MSFRRFSLAAGVALIGAACGVSGPSGNTVETFSGTLQVGGSNTHSGYTVSKNGEVEVTMTSVTPTPFGGPIAMGLGQVLSGGCQPLGQAYLTTAIVNKKASFGLLNKGTYCLVVFDPGVLIAPLSYAGNFSHP